MKRIKRNISLITAIILCVLTVSSATCTILCSVDDDVSNAQFFAMSFSDRLRAIPEPSIATPETKAVISWLRKNEPVLDKEELYKLGKSADGFFSPEIEQNGRALSGEDLYNSGKHISYYLRI